MIVPPFASVAEADAYHADHLFGDVWESDMEPEDKRRALITASKLLLQHVPWLSVYASAVSAVPAELRDATSEYARRLFDRGDPFAGSDTEGIKALKAGPVDIDFTDAASAGAVSAVPQEVLAMIWPLQAWRGSSLNVPLVRY